MSNESKLAATWCPACEDFLCTDCNRHHAKSSSSKKHIVISMENYPIVPSFIISIKNRCTKHGNKYELYCSIHNKAKLPTVVPFKNTPIFIYAFNMRTIYPVIYSKYLFIYFSEPHWWRKIVSVLSSSAVDRGL
jgi:hypothetical protein